MIKERRDAAGLSFAKAARRAGITPAYWHAVERAAPAGKTGRPSTPSVPVLRAMAEVLGMPRSELLELAGYDDDASIDRAAEMRGQAAGAGPLDLEDVSLYTRVTKLDTKQRAAVEAMLDSWLEGEDVE